MAMWGLMLERDLMRQVKCCHGVRATGWRR
jgi:hypothetical protein